MKNSNSIIYAVIFSLAIFSYTAIAQPSGPSSIERGESESGAVVGGVVQEADGGNVTPLDVVANQQTQRWQGFYGNVSGNLTLDDASGNTLYQWAVTTPTGEIFAVNSSVTPIWTNVSCLDLSKTETEQRVTLTEMEADYGMAATDDDGVDETFNLSFSGSITVAGVTINSASGCNQTSLNVDDARDETSFNEILLTDNGTDESVIYTAILEQDADAFKDNNEPADFQMIVGEDGATEGTKSYYFYVELG